MTEKGRMSKIDGKTNGRNSKSADYMCQPNAEATQRDFEKNWRWAVESLEDYNIELLSENASQDNDIRFEKGA